MGPKGLEERGSMAPQSREKAIFLEGRNAVLGSSFLLNIGNISHCLKVISSGESRDQHPTL